MDRSTGREGRGEGDDGVLLQGVRYKKTIMVLAGFAAGWLDAYLLAHWEGYDHIRFAHPHLSEPFNTILGIFFGMIFAFYPQIITMGVMGYLLGKGTSERVKLAVIGLVVAVPFWHLGLLFMIGLGATVK